MSAQGLNQIVQDGLILYLDAGNNKSINGTGSSIFNNLIKSDINGILLNGASFSTQDKGGITLDGVNDNILLNKKLPITNVFTINIWVKFNVLGTNVGGNNRRTIFNHGYNYATSDATAKGFLFLGSANNGTDFFLSFGHDTKVTVSSQGYISTNKIFMLSACVNNTDLVRLYCNGVEVNYFAQRNADTTVNYDNTPFTIGASVIPLTSQYEDKTNGVIYQTQVYNRALSSQEILQNYNVHKSRYI